MRHCVFDQNIFLPHDCCNLSVHALLATVPPPLPPSTRRPGTLYPPWNLNPPYPDLQAITEKIKQNEESIKVYGDLDTLRTDADQRKRVCVGTITFTRDSLVVPGGLGLAFRYFEIHTIQGFWAQIDVPI